MDDGRLHRGLPPPGVLAGEVVATIGVFDGVHLGHRRLLHAVAGDAGGAGETVLITFDPHPRCILDPAGCPPLLTAPAERAMLAVGCGVSTTIVVPFTRELSTWTAERFCDRLLESMALRRLWIGPGFALGRGREGNEEFLSRYGAAHGFEVRTVAPLVIDGERVSSGAVRAALAAGRVDRAAELLGRPYRLRGTVERGDGRGRTLGFPTANLAVAAERCVPAAGIYATWFGADGRWYPAATSIGTRPTFGGASRTIEGHLLDADVDLYGADARLDFVARLRDELAFPNADTLVAQMRDDVRAVAAVLEGRREPEMLP
jgi:riboflavin kinase/FMN adenylyltransferase